MADPSQAPFRHLPFIARDVELRRAAGGTQYLRSRIPSAPVAAHLPQIFERSAIAYPGRPWLAQRRGPARQWQVLNYGDGKRQIDAITQALISLDRPGRPVMVLSGNSIEHGVLQVAAMQAGMAHVAVTPAYSLLSTDLAKLQWMVDLIEPGVVFVQSAQQFERSLRGLRLPGDVVLMCFEHPLAGLAMLRWQNLLQTRVTAQVQVSIDAIQGDTVAKYLFTSGSTGTPKAVIVTQRMLAAAVSMHRQMVEYPAGAPPNVVLSWMPWSHVAAGLAQFCNAVAEGGVLYLDEGKPVPGAFDETLRNLRDLPVTQFSSVPVGFTMLVDALEVDEALAKKFFSQLQRMGYSGAKLPDSVSSRMQALAVAHTGHRIPFISAYGSTETAASVTMLHWTADSAGGIGLPHPGVELKLVPIEEEWAAEGGDERFELRVRSPAVTPGYFKNPAGTAAAFDEEGYFLMGDAVRFHDPANPREGLVFAGRVAEEFKLQTGIFVRAGALRVEAIESASGLLSDVVVTGADQAFVGLLAWPNLAACRARCGNAAITIAELVGSSWLRDAVRAAFLAHNQRHSGSSMRIQRVRLLATPPSLATGEITDKGYINQRTVLQLRANEVSRLYVQVPDPDVIVIG